ncbi:MAG: bifunctional proline dehydrogenase/L-glutamate gamma-semialdehyde dehydrogenase PutA [Geminicoccaceae bacterium]|nr:bifunctional proline dehydrogenase/L-glutamate gamma-semialdehyde dehydrogenase PutA [Geminicoccaceae bacterium]MCX7630365.1 bifunctional proline dehydrogenase/L-glutamate gamma-semialdehyde dehydrogenase PutA [Geminicoccaceae bacterium]MDW8124240.1 bifunctional proline dehydrogenase/L-glutamate gamma-semialdehyde dehydrogenase PutA [Geminicoccaceae bacterium]MDW8341151.1 bifunctional proline dehydrogenase/L-glutamate gamma-semialdehyde dehydrogenase PutA [Geminicoccaceae bacterium]
MEILADLPAAPADPGRTAIAAATREEESAAARRLLAALADLPPGLSARAERRARRLAEAVRREAPRAAGVETFLEVWGLDSEEGVTLMCLAEALLRIPDVATQDLLLKDKLAERHWLERVRGKADLWLSAAAWGLALSGRIVELENDALAGRLGRLLARLGEPVVREALRAAMRLIGRQFVLGQTIEEAIARSREAEHAGYLFSFDMLGEAARTRADAERYYGAYRRALEAVARAAEPAELTRRPSLSIKLSALHPRWEFAKWRRLEAELLPSVRALVGRARELEIPITVDAEEADRLEPMLDLFAALCRDPVARGWNGLGLAVQAYQKRALFVLDWLADLARATDRRIPVRLVKGAYWDAEIKRAQQQGLDDYPVWTRKTTTDVAFLACARRLLRAGDLFWPQFATHNAHTLAWVLEAAEGRRTFELQKLHGMGDALYRELRAEEPDLAVRVYAPVGAHAELLPYLVRRLLENGASSSFVHRVLDPATDLEELVADPIARLAALEPKPHPAIPRPRALFGPARCAGRGYDLADPLVLRELRRAMNAALARRRTTGPSAVLDPPARLPRHAVRDPADRRRVLGEVAFADPPVAERAIAVASKAFASWSRTPVTERAAILERAADLFEEELPALAALCVREAGKTVADAIADVREAVDYLRYYATEARRLLSAPAPLPGPVGESNRLELAPRGVFVAISPWNFPIAIFTGQIAAALVTGNSVVAKPAEQTNLCADAVVALMYRAGVPEDVLLFVPGEGSVVGAALVSDPRVAGVVFTGGTETARAIHRAMAAQDAPIRPLIAETGGINAMIVESSALLEQVTADVLESCFRSAGQRCSALRVLCVQEEIADRLIEMILGAAAELETGDPGLLATDVGPVIDEEAKAALERHLQTILGYGRLLFRGPLGPAHAHGSFFPPTVVAIDRVGRLVREPFGPILHVVRFRREELDRLLEEIHATGYGLTFGLHSRIDETIARVLARVRCGNVYVNRSMIGAVVGSQPFGGEGLSGTGFKAGGPFYLLRFLTERTVTVNTAAVGGSLELLGSLSD